MTFINHSINKIKIIVINKKTRLSSLNSGSLNTFNKQIINCESLHSINKYNKL